MFSFYLNFNINVLANIWLSTNLSILLPPMPVLLSTWPMIEYPT